MALFTPDEAVAELDRLLPVLDEIVSLRADAAELAAAVTAGGPTTPLGGVPEFKAAQARLDELLTEVQQTGASSRASPPCWSISGAKSTGPTCCSAGWRATGPSAGTTGSTSASPVAGRCRSGRQSRPPGSPRLTP